MKTGREARLEVALREVLGSYRHLYVLQPHWVDIAAGETRFRTIPEVAAALELLAEISGDRASGKEGEPQ